MKTLLTVENVNTYIEGDFPFGSLDHALSFYLPGFFMSEMFRKCGKCQINIPRKTGRCPKCQKPRRWDGKKHLMLKGRKTPYFPTGCLPQVLRILEDYGLEATFHDNRVPGLGISSEAAYKVILNNPKEPQTKLELWKHQQDAIAAALRYERGVIQSPTASGKSAIIGALAKILPVSGLILINNTSIAKQLRDDIAIMIGENVGFIKSKTWDVQRITVATTQSLINKLALVDKKKVATQQALELAKNCRLLMLDECHHTSSNTWYTLTKHLSNAYYRFGLTGTPFMRTQGDDLLLVGATGELIYEVSEEELIASGKIARPIIHFYRIDEPYIDSNVSYSEAYSQGVVHNQKSNKLAAQMIEGLYKKGAQILVLVEQKPHFDEIIRHMSNKIPYEILTGESQLEEREEVKADFIAGKTKIIFATKIFDEGVSLDNIDVVFRMGLLKTPIKTKQQVGRGQRNKKNKPNIVHIVDWLYTNNRYLAEHSLAHFNMYKQLKYEIKLEESPFF